MTNRAVHVGLVISLTFNNFFLAFGRFTDDRGPAKLLYSDNRSIFDCAEKGLSELLYLIDFGHALREQQELLSRISIYAPLKAMRRNL